jgi:hypothetical protein
MQLLTGSVADPECLSRISDPDFYLSRISDLGSRIPDPTTATKGGGGGIGCSTFFVATNITKLKTILFLDW